MEWVWQRDYVNHAEAMRDVFAYIVGFCNSVRLYSKLGYLPHTAYERDIAEKTPYWGIRKYSASREFEGEVALAYGKLKTSIPELMLKIKGCLFKFSFYRKKTFV